MEINEFAQKYQIPILNADSKFPEFFATHTIVDERVLNEDYLLCPDLLSEKHLICEVDKFLGETKYVFFALGKGYLKKKGTIGLIYDPFELAKITGVNLVKNDLLYELDKTDLLNEFCQKHLKTISSFIKKDSAKITKTAEDNYDTKLTEKEQNNLFSNFNNQLSKKMSLLICDYNNRNHLIFTIVFDTFLANMPGNLTKELITQLEGIKSKIIHENLDKEIKTLFETENEFLNKFSDEITEERMPEIRIPTKHQINKGLIGINKNEYE